MLIFTLNINILLNNINSIYNILINIFYDNIINIYLNLKYIYNK